MADKVTVVDFEAWESGLEARLGAMFEARDRDKMTPQQISEAVAVGCMMALDRLRKTDEGRAILKDLWDMALSHAGDTTSRAIGRRALTALGGALFAAGVWFLAVGGNGK